MSAESTRRLLAIASVALIGLLVGVATTGLPQTVTSDVESGDIDPPAPPTTSAVPAPPSAVSASTDVVASSEATASSAAPTTDDESGPTTDDESGPDEGTGTTAAPTTQSTTMPTSFTPSSTTTTTPTSTALAPPGSVSVVVANATDYPGLAADARDTLRGLGYGDVVATDSRENRQTSTVYFRPARSGEARRVAEQLGLASDDVASQPEESVTVDDLVGDIVVLLGADQL